MKLKWSCAACNESFISCNLLYSHIRKIHNKNAKEYYDTYLKKFDEGVCLNCGKETKLNNNTLGYLKFCCLNCCTEYYIKQRKNNPIKKQSTGKYICKICNKNVNSVGSHVRQFHHLNVKDYYDKYLKQQNEGICPVCGKETTFRGITKGYLKHCSTKCNNNDPETFKQKQETSIREHGVLNYRNSEQARQTLAKHIADGSIKLKEINQSKAETDIIEQIKCYYYKTIIHGDRNELNGYEIDIWLPDIRLGIEYDGYFWHADPSRFKPNDIVINNKTAQEIWDKDKYKDILAETKGIKLIRIKEKDYMEKRIDILTKLYKYIIENDK